MPNILQQIKIKSAWNIIKEPPVWIASIILDLNRGMLSKPLNKVAGNHYSTLLSDIQHAAITGICIWDCNKSYTSVVEIRVKLRE